MNYLDLETLTEKERNTRKLSRKFKKQNLYTPQYLWYYLKHATKYKFNTMPVLLAIKNFDYNINHIITRENKKNKTWWLDANQTYKFIVHFDFYLSNELPFAYSVEQTNEKFLNPYIKKFIKSKNIKYIENTDNQWLFDRAYFFWQCEEYEMSKHYCNVHAPKTLKNDEITSLNLREYRIINNFPIEESRMKVQLEPIFSKKEIGKMFDYRTFGYYSGL